jgi:surfeit locus 1 family protein
LAGDPAHELGLELWSWLLPGQSLQQPLHHRPKLFQSSPPKLRPHRFNPPQLSRKSLGPTHSRPGIQYKGCLYLLSKMKAFTRLAAPFQARQTRQTLGKGLRGSCRAHRTIPASPPSSAPRRPFSQSARCHDKLQPADDPNFTSILDNPPNLVRAGRRHGPGLIILAIIPITAFALGSWQVQRLQWKTDLIAKCEDRLFREPLPLPPRVDPDVVAEEFDYRRVYCSGTLRHDQEMLIGPRMRDGEQGYMVVTPLERPGGSTVLVNRGWIPKRLKDQRARAKDSLPTGEVTVEGLLRKPWKKNMFTPENRPEKREFYFPDVKQMAELTGAQPVWIEATMGEWSLSSTCNLDATHTLASLRTTGAAR